METKRCMVIPQGSLKAIKCAGRYFMIFDFNPDITNTLVNLYSIMSEEEAELLDTGYKIDLACFEYITCELLSVYKLERHTFTDIVHVIKYAIEFDKKRRDFLYKEFYTPRRTILINTKDENDTLDVMCCVFNNVLVKSACVCMKRNTMKLFATLVKVMYSDFEIVQEEIVPSTT